MITAATLLIFCSDTISVSDRVTFCSYDDKGFHITHWFEDANDSNLRLESMFNVLFEEMLKQKTLPLEKQNI